MVQFGNSWDTVLKGEFDLPYYKELRQFLKAEYKTQTIYPPMEDIFNTLKGTAYEDVKVVILGQDPYHGAGQGHGFAFSVQPGIQTPPSLRNMYKELAENLGTYIPNNGYLLPWAKQGVLMLNAVLTVREGQANSHKGKGWEHFTDHVIAELNKREEPIVFLLWGRFAQNKGALVTNPQHLILKAAHPSPLSAHNGFFGCKHFSMTNDFLVKNGMKAIDWQIENL
ncbi:uracil-DNA glycosylase [Chakrabartyella piscis]|uniref:uracil-DNA glycosylase n=1 Tax=Chakrabartyella piscis TaxID=2918914 RepID=UPI0029588BED|nr:uracil-DNA glycosylase [Chakrabartyella piscis]